jgi:hypothetical protein
MWTAWVETVAWSHRTKSVLARFVAQLRNRVAAMAFQQWLESWADCQHEQGMLRKVRHTPTNTRSPTRTLPPLNISLLSFCLHKRSGEGVLPHSVPLPPVTPPLLPWLAGDQVLPHALAAARVHHVGGRDRPSGFAA